MRPQDAAVRAAALLLGIALLLSLAIQLALDREWYHAHLEKHGSHSRFASREEADAAADAVLDYLAGERESLPPPFTPEEQSHLWDVRLLLARASLARGVLAVIALLILSAAMFSGSPASTLFSALTWTGIASLALCGALALGGLTFSTFFTLFHLVFFPQGNWQFSPESVLIRLFPQGFFFDVFLALLARMALLGALMLSPQLLQRFKKS
ncbi:DUF1461 domain-containing protein [Candidatus Woesearchaeota archaeon]|nr:DUF1461 domain-containing protein [Candidatus Woesearchaeota archaeon]